MSNFFGEFIKNPKMIGTGIPCFPSLVNAMLENIDFSKDITIIEYWPWNWNFLQELIENITNNSKIISIELNEWFYNSCKEKFDDSRLQIVNDTAENVKNYIEKNVDYIISWVPLSALDIKTRENILYSSYDILKKNWTYLQYQYFSSAKSQIQKVFPNIEKKRVVKHVPPAIYYICNK